MIKLLAVDMDGTCLDSEGKMREETLNALKKAAEKGVVVVPTTGRNATCLPLKLRNETFFRYIISSNGSLVLDRETGEEIFTAYIDNETGVKICKEFRKHFLLIGAHINREFYVQGRLLHYGVKKFFKNDDIVIHRVKNMSKAVSDSRLKIEEFQLFYKGINYKDIIRKIIAPYGEITSAHAKDYAEIFNAKGSKGTALLALAEMLGVDKSEIACIGDEENDISMFRAVDNGFAMGNAIEPLKKIAKFVLPSNDENGVAYAIEKYVLSE